MITLLILVSATTLVCFLSCLWWLRVLVEAVRRRDDEIQRLNGIIQEKTIPALLGSTDALSEVSSYLNVLRIKCECRRRIHIGCGCRR